MGLFACRAGASRVYSIEMGGMAGVAQANGYSDRVVLIKAYSTDVGLPERVDVVIADQIGNFGFTAGIIGYFADARRRFLKPEGVTIPLRMNLMLAPVEGPDLFAQVEFWNTAPAGFDFRSTRMLAANTGHHVNLAAENVCGDAVDIANIDLNHASPEPFHGEATATIRRSCTLHGLGGWFVAELAKGVSMTNSPLAVQRIVRQQEFFPIDRAVQVAEGDLVKIRMTVRPVDKIVNWKDSFRHSTWRGC